MDGMQKCEIEATASWEKSRISKKFQRYCQQQALVTLRDVDSFEENTSPKLIKPIAVGIVPLETIISK